jgi:hypothetical protein
MLLHDAPSPELVAELSPEHAQVVEDGARLRTGLPAYLELRRNLLAAHCPIIAPLMEIISGYEEPTTTEEFWATLPDYPVMLVTPADLEDHERLLAPSPRESEHF